MFEMTNVRKHKPTTDNSTRNDENPIRNKEM